MTINNKNGLLGSCESVSWSDLLNAPDLDMSKLDVSKEDPPWDSLHKSRAKLSDETPISRIKSGIPVGLGCLTEGVEWLLDVGCFLHPEGGWISWYLSDSCRESDFGFQIFLSVYFSRPANARLRCFVLNFLHRRNFYTSLADKPLELIIPSDCTRKKTGKLFYDILNLFRQAPSQDGGNYLFV